MEAIQRSIQSSRHVLETSQQEQLTALFSSPGWSVLRDVISAHCVEAQTNYLDASLYDTESAGDKAASDMALARKFNTTLDVLDAIQRNSDQWFRITIEPRR